MEDNRSFISRWFGFSGWKVMSAKARISIQILYRIFFLIGPGVLIVLYGIITGSDPNGIAILALIFIWFLIFQFLVNLIFVEGS
jgi:hypothetical protein